MDDRIATLDKKLDNILEKLDTVEKRISDIESNVWIIARFQETENSLDSLMGETIKFLSKITSVSAEDLQRKFNIGNARAVRILDQLKSLTYVENGPNLKNFVIKRNLNILKTKNGQFTKDPLYLKAYEIVIQYDKVSSALIQRRLSIGYARAARILDELEEGGVIGPAKGGKLRKILKHDSIR